MQLKLFTKSPNVLCKKQQKQTCLNKLLLEMTNTVSRVCVIKVRFLRGRVLLWNLISLCMAVFPFLTHSFKKNWLNLVPLEQHAWNFSTLISQSFRYDRKATSYSKNMNKNTTRTSAKFANVLYHRWVLLGLRNESDFAVNLRI